METAQQEERLQLIDRVFHLDPETYIYGGLGANIGLVANEIERDYTRTDFLKWDIQNIHRVAVAKAQSGALAVNPRYVQAFQDAFSGDAAQKSGIGANESMILGQLVARDLPCTVENIQGLISELWSQLADNPQYTQQETAKNLRARRIADMTGNSTHGFSVTVGPRKYAFDSRGRTFDYQRGMAQGFSLAAKGAWSPGYGGGFDSMDDAQVENIWNLWRTSQDLKSKSVEELRAIVKNGGHTDAFGNHQSLQLPSTGSTRDEGALINEQTGEEITTQKALIRYISNPNDPYAGRRLITHKTSGKVIAAKKARFEKVIRGDLG